MKEKNNFNESIKGQIPKYLERMNNGDIEARNKLICHYSKNITNFIEKNLSNKCLSKEDLIQSCILALIEILDNFKSNNVNLLNRKINYIIKDEFNKQINSKSNSIVTKDITYIEKYEEIENRNIVLEAVKKLPDKKRNIILLYFYKGYPEETIADMFNITHQYVHQAITEGIQFVKQQVYFNSIDGKDNSVILNFINKNLDKSVNISDEDKLKLFYTYIKNISIKKKKIIYIYLYNNFSTQEIANIFNTTEEKIAKIINEFVIFLNSRINIRFDNKDEYNYILYTLCNNLKEYNPEEIKVALLELMQQDNAIIERYTNTTNIKLKCRMLSLILLKTKKILKENCFEKINYQKKK